MLQKHVSCEVRGQKRGYAELTAEDEDARIQAKKPRNSWTSFVFKVKDRVTQRLSEWFANGKETDGFSRSTMDDMRSSSLFAARGVNSAKSAIAGGGQYLDDCVADFQFMPRKDYDKLGVSSEVKVAQDCSFIPHTVIAKGPSYMPHKSATNGCMTSSVEGTSPGLQGKPLPLNIKDSIGHGSVLCNGAVSSNWCSSTANKRQECMQPRFETVDCNHSTQKADAVREGPAIVNGKTPISTNYSNALTLSVLDATYPKSVSKHATSGYRRKLIAQECIDLEEKERYRQLLQSFTQHPLAGRHQPAFYRARLTAGICAGLRHVPVSRDVNYVKPWVARLPSASDVIVNDSIEEKSPNATSGSCLQYSSVSPPGGSVLRSPEISCPKTITASTLSSGCIGGPIPSSVQRTRTLSPTSRKHFQVSTSPFATDSWLREIQEKFEHRSRERRRRIAEEETKMRILAEKRAERDANIEKVIRDRLSLIELAVLEEKAEEEGLPALSEEAEEMVDNALRRGNPGDLLSEAFNLQIRRRDIETFNHINWLNDEVINFYMNLIMERSEQGGLPKVYAFNTFFYPKLMSSGHDGLKRWTRRVDLFSMDKVIIPVHLGVHWCLAVADFRSKTLKYYDSMGGSNTLCLKALKNYLQAESLDKKKQELDVSAWREEIVKGLPQQMNGGDCGVFACKFAEYLSRDAPITFTQDDMPYFRRRIVYEILTKRLL